MKQLSFLYESHTFHKPIGDKTFYHCRSNLMFALDNISADVQARRRNNKLLPLVGESYVIVKNIP